MPETDTSAAYNPERASSDDEEQSQREVRSWRRFFSFWYALLYLLVLCIVLLAVLPPLLNVNRFKRRIVTSISTSLGRPVHLDNVSLVLLPFPGFKLENFVVAEDPAFGSEPVIHANNVQATLRMSSLWTRKVEFSKIALREPSINLVRSAAGVWNVESILLQAARIPAAPTAQTKAGADPRFPYIEATEARVNVKFGIEKMPLSLTEAEFALWLPRPQQWRIRAEGKPTRTDTVTSYTGTVSLEGTLGRAETFDTIPLDLFGEWKNAPLGEASRLVTGQDMGLRGDLKLNVEVHGTVGESALKTTVEMKGARLAEFVPPQALDIRAECQAKGAEKFHAFHEIRCTWPPQGEPSLLALAGDIAAIHKHDVPSFEVGSPGLPAAVLLQWLRVASPRVSPDITATGTLTGMTHESSASGFGGSLALTQASLSGGPIGDTPVALGDLTIASGSSANAVSTSSRRDRVHGRSAAAATAQRGDFVMSPTTLSLGGKEPATLEGRFDGSGYSLHLSGNVLASRLLALATAVPQFGDGIEAVLPVQAQASASTAKEVPIHVDAVSSRKWGGGQSWIKTAAKPVKSAARRHR